MPLITTNVLQYNHVKTEFLQFLIYNLLHKDEFKKRITQAEYLENSTQRSKVL